MRCDASLVRGFRDLLARATTSSESRDGLAVHGILDAAALAHIRADALREVVAPCLDALAA